MFLRDRMITHTTIALRVLLIVSSFIILACSSSNRRSEMTAEGRKEAIEATLEWGRLAPFPTSAREIKVKAEGGPFSRSFHCQFSASKSELEAWIKSSPGLLEAESTYGDGKTNYRIKPGGGANRAEVTIGDDGSVQIYTSWS